MKTIRTFRRFLPLSIFILIFAAASVLLLHPSLAEPNASIAPLNHRVLDAEYSKQLDRIVTVSATPLNQLHVVNPLTGASVAVDLPLAPACVSVGPDGLFAAVGHNGWISYINLSTHALIKTLPVSTDVVDIVLAGNGWIYAFPRSGGWGTIKCVKIETGEEIPSGGYSVNTGTLAKLHPNGTAMYGADNGVSPSDIEKYGITPQGQAVLLYDSPYHGDYAMCGNLWISEDGFRIFTRCGNVFRSSESRAEDMLYNGSLGGIGSVVDLVHSASINKILAIPSNTDREVWKYDYGFLTFESKIRLPGFSVNGQTYPSHGRFVFFNADGSRYSVIVQADASAGLLLDYGISTVGPESEQFTIQATAGSGGTIIPSGEVGVGEGTFVTFTIVPDSGYEVTDVIIDGVMVGIRMSYSFENVAANHSIEALFTRSSSSSIAPLNHRVLDAEYSKQLDRIVTVSATPLNQLHIIDPLTGASVAVDLPLAPTCVSVGPDGLFAAVGHNGWISYVNLSTHALIKTLPVTVDVLDIVLAGNGWVYAFPRRDQWTTIRCVDLESGVEVQNGGQYIYAGTLAKLHPSGNAMYGADNGLSPSDIEKYGITPQGQAVLLYDSPYHGDYAMCGNLWISEDGFRIFTKCGNVFRSSEIRAEDMVYNGSLGSIGSVADLSHSTSANKILAIPGNIYGQRANSDTEVWKYDSTYLSFESKIRLPVVFLNGQAYSSHGKFVFFSTDGSRYSVVVQADPSSGMLLDYGIFTLGTNIGQFFIHASATMGGTITPFGAVAVYQGNNQSFTITPSTGYHLTDVVVDSNSVGAVTSYEFIGVTADHTILAYFAADAYNLTVSATGTGSGMITTDPAGITCGAHCSEAFNSGSVVMLIATPAKGSIFAGWIGNVDCSDGQVTMNADKTCIATFTRLSKMADFNGDGKTDIAIYRSSNGTWYVYPSGGNPPFGLRWGGDFSDIPVAGDYDGDGESDIAFYRGNTGAWWIIPSSGVGPRGQVGAYELGWGGTGYKPVPGNYDGDAKTDIAIYETSTGAWWIIPSSGVGPQGQVGAYGIGWGGPAFKPVPGDYDGDGKTDIAIYDTTGGAWWIIPSSGASAYGVGWGGSAFTPVPGDYDGDGKTDMAIYETNTGTWWIIPSSTITPPTPYGVPYGMGWGGDISDVPLTTNPD